MTSKSVFGKGHLGTVKDQNCSRPMILLDILVTFAQKISDSMNNR